MLLQVDTPFHKRTRNTSAVFHTYNYAEGSCIIPAVSGLYYLSCMSCISRPVSRSRYQLYGSHYQLYAAQNGMRLIEPWGCVA